MNKKHTIAVAGTDYVWLSIAVLLAQHLSYDDRKNHEKLRNITKIRFQVHKTP